MTKIPSSGSMVRVKLRRSSGFGKTIFIVFGRESSVMSRKMSQAHKQGWEEGDLFEHEFGPR